MPHIILKDLLIKKASWLVPRNLLRSCLESFEQRLGHEVEVSTCPGAGHVELVAGKRCKPSGDGLPCIPSRMSNYRSSLFNRTCQALGIKHTFTRPYRPQTNGKAERFIQTCLREWAYGRTYTNSAERTAWLPAFLAYYNARRPHSALDYKTPASRLGRNNLLQLDIQFAAGICQPFRGQSSHPNKVSLKPAAAHLSANLV